MGKTAIVYFFCFSILLVAGSKIPSSAQEQDVLRLSNIALTTTGLPQTNDFDPAKIAANIIFSGIGFIAFMYGKKNAFWRPMMIGMVLMAYSYFLSGTIVIYIVGIALSAALYFWRE